MEIYRAGDIPVRPGPAEYFTGQVRIEALFNPAAPDRVQGARVTFQPGARTAWHTHPLGQTLIVTEGEGRVQRAGGPVEAIHPGDVICFAPGERHWHGAAPDSVLTHIAVHEVHDGRSVDWLEPVSEAEYRD